MYMIRNLEYNTEREKLEMPEYGRNVLKMVEDVKRIEDRAERSRQAKAVVRVMELLNPQVHQQEDWEHKLWDHLYIIAGYDLDVDSPFPAPAPESRQEPPMRIPLKTKPVKATHYGRNIESIIDLIASEEDGEEKTVMLRRLAVYMRQQYLIWNKDTVADETILNDMARLAAGKLEIPEGIELGAVHGEFNRPRALDARQGQPFGKKKNKKRRSNNGH